MIVFDGNEDFVKNFKGMAREEKMCLVNRLKELAGHDHGPLLFLGPCNQIREEFLSLWNCTPVDIFGDSSPLPHPQVK